MNLGFQSKVKELTGQVISAEIKKRTPLDESGKPQHPMTMEEFVTWFYEIAQEYKCEVVFTVTIAMYENGLERMFSAEFRKLKI